MTDKETSLYRHFAEDGTLLYVGISLCPISRNYQHKLLTSWFPDVRRIDIEPFPNREAAKLAEVQAVARENPLYNRRLAGRGRTREDKRQIEIATSELPPFSILPRPHIAASDGIHRMGYVRPVAGCSTEEQIAWLLAAGVDSRDIWLEDDSGEALRLMLKDYRSGDRLLAWSPEVFNAADQFAYGPGKEDRHA